MLQPSFDLVIIGGGYVGAWCAFFASDSHSEWTIAVIDKSKIGSGTSHFGADLDFPNNRSPIIQKMSSRSRGHFAKLADEIDDFPIQKLDAFVIGKPIGFKKNGFSKGLQKCDTAQLPIILGNTVAVQPGQQIQGPLNCYRANGKTTIPKLLKASQRRNGNLSVFEGAEVLDVTYDEQASCNIISLDVGATIRAKYVISCTGPWSKQLPWGSAFKTDWNIKKIVSFYIDCNSNQEDSLLYFLDDDAFLMPMVEKGNWLLSISSKEWGCDPQKNLSANEEERAQAKTILDKYAPEMLPYLIPGRVFCDAYSSDRSPRVVPHKDNPSHVLAGGCGGSGYRLAPALAEETVRTLLNTI